MANFTVEFPEAQINRAITELGNRAPRAIVRAINRGAVTARTVMARDMADDTGLGVRTVTAELNISKATPERMQGRISVSGSPIPLIKWNPSVSKRNGVRAKLPPPGKGHYPHAFKARMPTGHVGIYSRTQHTRGAKVMGRRGKATLEKIDQLHGPSLPSVFRKLSPKAIAAGQESLLKNLEHEIAFELSKIDQ